MERVVRGMQRILEYLLWKEHQEAKLNTHFVDGETEAQ